MVKIGVIGCGRIAERHVEAYRRLGDVEVIVADTDQPAARRLADTHHVTWRSGPAELLGAPDLDAIDVCVPTIHHAQIVVDALRAGKAVFCEKPLCYSLEEAEAIAQAQRETGGLVMVGYLYRFHPAFQFAKQVLDEGVIGRPHFGIFRLGGRGSHRAWKHTAESGGGAILEMAVHNLDLVQYLLGLANEVQVHARYTLWTERSIDGRPFVGNAEDYVLATMRIDGAEMIVESDLITPSYMNYVEIQGDNGTLFTSILNFMPTVVYCREPRGVFNLGNNIRHFETVNLFGLELGHFVRAMRGEVAAFNGVEDSVHTMRLVEQIRNTERPA